MCLWMDFIRFPSSGASIDVKPSLISVGVQALHLPFPKYNNNPRLSQANLVGYPNMIKYIIFDHIWSYLSYPRGKNGHKKRTSLSSSWVSSRDICKSVVHDHPPDSLNLGRVQKTPKHSTSWCGFAGPTTGQAAIEPFPAMSAHVVGIKGTKVVSSCETYWKIYWTTMKNCWNHGWEGIALQIMEPNIWCCKAPIPFRFQLWRKAFWECPAVVGPLVPFMNKSDNRKLLYEW